MDVYVCLLKKQYIVKKLFFIESKKAKYQLHVLV